MNSRACCAALGRSVAGVVAMLLPAMLLAAADARDIMSAVQHQDTSQDEFVSAAFEVFDRDGHSAVKDFSYRRIVGAADTRTLLAFTDPPALRGVEFLSVSRAGESVAQFIYVPATQRVRSIAAQQRSARFIGTDFTYEDIAAHPLDDFSYQLLGDGEVLEGHKTRKITATPVDAGRSQYKYLNYWIAQDAPIALQIEMFDSQGSLVRTLRASGLRNVHGIWGARRLEMRSPPEGTRTVLSIRRVRFNTHPDAALFTPDALGKAQGLDTPQGDDAAD